MRAAFNHTLHKKMWDLVAEHPTVTKYDAMGRLNLPHILCSCFACAACDVECRICPLSWEVGKRCMQHDNSLWQKYLNARTDYHNEDDTERSHGKYGLEIVSLARRIRDTPVSTEWQWGVI